MTVTRSFIELKESEVLIHRAPIAVGADGDPSARARSKRAIALCACCALNNAARRR